jgi:hypothetical protein
MKFKQIVFFIGLIGLAFTSCKKEDESPKPSPGKYSNGVWVLNEGIFGTPNGTLGFFSLDSGKYIANVYGLENGGLPTGDVLQYLFNSAGDIKIVANNDNKVLAIDKRNGRAEPNFESAQFNSPRSGLLANNGFFYFTNWGPWDNNFNLRESFVLKTAGDGSAVTKIQASPGAEKIIQYENKLFLSNNYSNSIEIIDLDPDSIVSSIIVGASPNEMLIHNDFLWVICEGSWGGDNGELYKIDLINNLQASVFFLGYNTGGALTIDNNETLYFYSGKTVYKFVLGTNGPEVFINQAVDNGIYGMEFIEGIGELWVSDHNNFVGNGKVKRYDLSGNFVSEFTAGILPNNFLDNP